MDEIEDKYNITVESIDLELLEALKKGSNRKLSIEKYRKSLRNAREKFEKSYEKFNKLKKSKLEYGKKRSLKKVKFDRLKVSHFEFKRNLYERDLLEGDLLLFNLSRRLHKFSDKIPSKVVYIYYKIFWTIKSLKRDFVEFKDINLDDFRKFSIKKSENFWINIKKFWNVLWKFSLTAWRIFSSKLFFWKNKPPISVLSDLKKEHDQDNLPIKESLKKLD